ncbi:hypothetical protein PsorP6_003563 [Peronosclerospora sorghi]|uniref:Uncharacterized protein n=1 Tax=Peronosclerospora sorghi TaxID=230839 RepID=A0ACC0VLK4_9STRA|nr:hypothetical protein PsorP6_003563 [Peronosclerospora sorghi]
MEPHSTDNPNASDALLVDATSLEKFEDNADLIVTRHKFEEEEEEEGEKEASRRRAVIKQSRRHNWQPKYEIEFGLQAIERDAASGDVLLAMCGFCKAFGREGKYEQLVQQDQESGNDSKKRRRRSLTTTKFFRAFRVDNIRSHLQGAHPRRWAEYEMLPKQETIRANYLNLQSDVNHLSMVDDVVLGASGLNSESDVTYTQAQAQASAISEAQHAAAQAAAQAAAHAAIATGLNGGSHNSTHVMVFS